MNIRYKNYGRRNDRRHPIESIMMQLAAVFLVLAGMTLTLFLLLLSALFSPVAVLAYWLKFRNGERATNHRGPVRRGPRNPGVIEGKYKVIDK